MTNAQLILPKYLVAIPSKGIATGTKPTVRWANEEFSAHLTVGFVIVAPGFEPAGVFVCGLIGKAKLGKHEET